MCLHVPRFVPGFWTPKTPNSGDNAASHDTSGDRDDTSAPVENGLPGLARRRRLDMTYMITRRHSEPTLYILSVAANRIERLYQEIQEARAAKSERVDELDKNLQRELSDYQQLVIQTRTVQQYERPNGRFLKRFLQSMKKLLCETDALFLGGPLEDWIMVHGLERLELWVRNAPEYPCGGFLLHLFKTKVETEGMIYESYPLKVFTVLLYALVNCTLAAFLGVPVALSALDITSTDAYVGTYLAFLFVFGIMIQAVIPGHMVQAVLSLAYAAVLVANMKGD
ncbi:hypothetical protein ACJ41O_013429 [Fusarium nematophilum]